MLAAGRTGHDHCSSDTPRTKHQVLRGSLPVRYTKSEALNTVWVTYKRHDHSLLRIVIGTATNSCMPDPNEKNLGL